MPHSTGDADGGGFVLRWAATLQLSSPLLHSSPFFFTFLHTDGKSMKEMKGGNEDERGGVDWVNVHAQKQEGRK